MLRVNNDDIPMIIHMSIPPLSWRFAEYDVQSIGHVLSRMMKNSWFGKDTLPIVFVFLTFCVVEKYDDAFTYDMELK